MKLTAYIIDPLERKRYGVFETPTWIFEQYILPRIINKLHAYLWVDLFCGTGNLILPILKYIPAEKRIEFFEKHILMYDILPEMVEVAIKKAISYGIPEDLARRNIRVRDTLRNYPLEMLKRDLKVYHITNPPYLYLGYIVKNKRLHFWLDYFKTIGEEYQDVYQLALINDLKHGIKNMIYIIPSNFLYGASVSNKIRMDMLQYYWIKEAIIFERKIFEHTGQHTGIFFFERKEKPSHEPQSFNVIKVGSRNVSGKVVEIHPSRKYRAGIIFEEFVEKYKVPNQVNIRFYLFEEVLKKNPGEEEIVCIDSNAYINGDYVRKVFKVSKAIAEKIKMNILFLKTLDGVREDEKAGIYEIRKIYNADCIVVSKAPYRTHPIQLFFEPPLSMEDQILLMKYFNTVLNYLRDISDSEFMTTYKYANTLFTRKYLGLTQARKLIQTLPLNSMTSEDKQRLLKATEENNIDEILNILDVIINKTRTRIQKKGLLLWFSKTI